MLDLAAANLLSPMVLFFVLGLMAALARVDLSFPEAVAKGLAVYLIVAIGFKGGASVSAYGLDLALVLALGAGFVLSALIPVVAFSILRLTTNLPKIEAAAVAAHYGSISVVTFVTATAFLGVQSVGYEGYLVAVVALMETPAIITGIWLARRGGGSSFGDPELMREVFLNGSVVLLTGGFVVGMVTGHDGFEGVKPFFKDMFSGVLCIFLLDMGLLAAARIRSAGLRRTSVIAFGLYMPLIGASIGALTGTVAGLSLGGTVLMAVLGASASYIAVPAAMRLALPEANPALYLSLSLAITFPFNIVIGIPLYFSAVRWIYGS